LIKIKLIEIKVWGNQGALGTTTLLLNSTKQEKRINLRRSSQHWAYPHFKKGSNISTCW